MSDQSTEQDSLSYLFPNRFEIVRHVRKESAFDLLIFGSGLGPATLAHLCAFNGLRTLLLSADDYIGNQPYEYGIAAAVRFGKLLSFGQAKRGLDDLLLIAPHLLRACKVQIARNRGVGLNELICSFMLKSAGLWERDFSPLEQFGGSLRRTGLFFRDAIVNVSRLTMERLVAARQEGAYCLNYARPQSFYRERTGKFLVECCNKIESTERGFCHVEATCVAVGSDVRIEIEGHGGASIGSEEGLYFMADEAPALVGGQAWQILAQLLERVSVKQRAMPLTGRVLPGAANLETITAECRNKVTELGCAPELMDAAISRFGSRVRYLFENDGWLEPTSDGCLRGEQELACQIEQATNLEDVKRRLGA